MDELWCFNLNNFTSIAKLTENRAALSCLVSIKLLFLEFFNFNFLVSLLSNSYRHFHSSHSYNSAAAAKSLQSCPTLCDPIDGSPLGSPVPGILQARTLEWVAISFSNAWKWKVKGKSLSHVRLFATPWTAAHQAVHGIFQARGLDWGAIAFSTYNSSLPYTPPLYLTAEDLMPIKACFYLDFCNSLWSSTFDPILTALNSSFCLL